MRIFSVVELVKLDFVVKWRAAKKCSLKETSVWTERKNFREATNVSKLRKRRESRGKRELNGYKNEGEWARVLEKAALEYGQRVL